MEQKEAKKSETKCCGKGFPTFAVILLVLAVLWLLGSLEVINVDVPWLPIVLIVVALGMIVNRFARK